MESSDEPFHERRAYPTSIWFLVAAIAAFLIQVAPFPGIILMFFMAVIWPTILLYVSMLGTVLEVVARRVSPAWLALPLVPLVVYEAEAIRQHSVARHLTAQVRSTNDRVSIPFDPTRNDLVLSSDGSVVTDGDAEWLISLTSLPRVFQGKAGSFRSYVTAGSRQCTRLSSVHTDATVLGVRTTDGSTERMPRDVACIVATRDEPSLPTVRVTYAVMGFTAGGVPSSRTMVVVVTPDGRRHVVQKIVSSPLSWYPLFLAGCYSELDANSKWSCHIKPARDSISSMDGRAATARMLLRALSVPVQPRDWASYDAPAIMDAILAHQAADAQAAYDAIVRGMEDASYAPTRDDVAAIHLDDQRLRAIAPRLIAWTTQHMYPDHPEGQIRCVASDPDSPSCKWKVAMSKRNTFLDILERGSGGPLGDLSSQIALLSHRRDVARAQGRESAVMAKRRRDAERRERDEERALQFMRIQRRLVAIRDPSTPQKERRRLLMEIDAERRETAIRR